jgi:hypothetical protein
VLLGELCKCTESLPGEVTLGIARGRTWKITEIFQVLPLTLPLVYVVAAACYGGKWRFCTEFVVNRGGVLYNQYGGFTYTIIIKKTEGLK